MSVNSQLTRKRITECAMREFLENGYLGANMRQIAQLAEVTTGAMYNHFANKSVLFDALVQVPAEEMRSRFLSIHQDVLETLPHVTYSHMKATANSGTDWMLDYVYQHFDVFRLIFCCSEGTRWSGYLDELVSIEERAYRVYCNSLGKDGKRIEDIFLHINATAGFQYLVECVSHHLPYEQAVSVLDNAKRFSMAGWETLLRLSP